MIQFIVSEELQAVRELLRGTDLGSLTIAERRRATASVAASPPAGTAVDPVDAGGVPAEWVAAPGVSAGVDRGRLMADDELMCPLSRVITDVLVDAVRRCEADKGAACLHRYSSVP